MKSDQEYLAEAGIDAETGGAPAQDTASTPPTPETKTESQPVEMFEISGQKYPVSTEFKLTHGGKVLNVPYQSMANTYRQWQHLQDKWNNDYKPKISEFEKLRPEFDKYKGFYDKYGSLQTWSEQNPQEWQRLWDLYQKKDQVLAQQPNQPNQPENPQLQAALKEINDLKQFKTSFEQEQQKKQELQDTEYVQGEIKEFQKSYPEINLNERDPDGVSLWGKILQYGIDQKLPTFKSAANIYLEQRLQDTWSSRARNEAVKGIQTDRSQGIVKRSQTPIMNNGQGMAPKALNLRKMSYAEIAEAAKEGRFAGAEG